jgi:hypothetical protein
MDDNTLHTEQQQMLSKVGDHIEMPILRMLILNKFQGDDDILFHLAAKSLAHIDEIPPGIHSTLWIATVEKFKQVIDGVFGEQPRKRCRHQETPDQQPGDPYNTPVPRGSGNKRPKRGKKLDFSDSEDSNSEKKASDSE